MKPKLEKQSTYKTFIVEVKGTRISQNYFCSIGRLTLGLKVEKDVLIFDQKQRTNSDRIYYFYKIIQKEIFQITRQYKY